MSNGPKEERVGGARLVDRRGDGGRKIVVLNNKPSEEKKAPVSPPSFSPSSLSARAQPQSTALNPIQGLQCLPLETTTVQITINFDFSALDRFLDHVDRELAIRLSLATAHNEKERVFDSRTRTLQQPPPPANHAEHKAPQGLEQTQCARPMQGHR